MKDSKVKKHTPMKVVGKVSPHMNLTEKTKAMTVVGTCTNLEKPYFRLGDAPDPAKVRPEYILKKTLKML
jgi:hypothetical protein